RRRLVIVAVGIAVASLAWSVYYTRSHPSASYFSTFSRAWELALGAVLAIVASRIVLTSLARVAIGWAGIVAIGAAGVLYSSGTPFPGYAALLPSVGAALVIAAGLSSAGAPRVAASRVLALAPLRYVGDRSYTFYLWHWPVLIIAERYAGHELSVRTKLALLACALA